MKEKQAIAQLKQGDLNGLEFLVRKYYLQAVRAAYLIVQDQAQAEDVVQETFISFQEKIYSFDETRSFRPWFFRIIVNNSISACRQRKLVLSLDDENDNNTQIERLIDLSNNGRSPEDTYIDAEICAEIWHALAQLSAQQRAAVVLRYYLDMSENELSEKLQRPKSSIKWLLFSARRKLSHLLKPLHADETASEEIQAQEK